MTLKPYWEIDEETQKPVSIDYEGTPENPKPTPIAGSYNTAL